MHHKLPISKGGKNTYSNWILLHTECHKDVRSNQDENKAKMLLERHLSKVSPNKKEKPVALWDVIL
jgi:5-methylcytosine-specific restriction endonuclease McrA